MQPFPHFYSVATHSANTGTIAVVAEGVEDMEVAAPREFDGPGTEWSPESLLVAGVASCFILTFRSVARAARLEWRRLDCKVVGQLERRDGITQFTRFVVHARLVVAAATPAGLGEELLSKAEHACLIANSLTAARELETEVVHDGSHVATA